MNAIRRPALTAVLAGALLLPAVLEASAQQEEPKSVRTLVSRESLPGVYRLQLSVYAFSLTLRPDGTFALDNMPKAAGLGERVEGSWSVDGQGRIAGICKPEGREEIAVLIDLKGACMEELGKTISASLTSKALGEKPMAVRLTRSGPYDPEADKLAKAKKGPPSAEGGDIKALLDYLASGRCAEDFCRAVKQGGENLLKKLLAKLDAEKRLADIQRKAEKIFSDD